MYRNLSIISAVVTCLAISMTACMLGEDIATLEKEASKKNLGDTVSITAIQGVTVPAASGTPVDKITDNEQYTGTVTWSSSDDPFFITDNTFKYQKKYTATITLKPKSGYTLYLVKADFFTVAGAESVSNPANSGVITAVFPLCTKSAGAAVDAPTLNTRTHNAITINPVSEPNTGQTVEYAINISNTEPSTGWQTGTTFSDLDAGITYYIFARSKANDNYNAGTASSLAVTTLLSVSPDRIEYYWVNDHGSLVTTSNGATSIVTGSTLTITAAADTDYVVKQWNVNGVNTGQRENTYNFTITTVGNHTVDLFLEKNGMLYNTSITITVGIYLVTFNINGGTGTNPPSQSVVSANSGITLPGGSGLSKTGYIFGGWNTNAYGTGTNYDAYDYYYPTSNITLYAKWNTVSSGGTANGSEANPYVLTAGIWNNGSITSNSSDSAVWYSFNVTNGNVYYVWWNDTDNGGGTLDIRVAAYYGNGTTIFDVDTGDSNSYSFTSDTTGIVKIKVYPYSSGNTGTFGIVYSNNGTRPQ